MNHRNILPFFLLMALAVLVAGCTGQQTVSPTPTAVTVPTPTEAASLPPTTTAGPTPTISVDLPAREANVTIAGSAFDPATVTIAAGGKVTWTNDDGIAHSIVVDGTTSPQFGQGKTYEKVFDVAGEYDYNCGIHPFMRGKVIVK